MKRKNTLHEKLQRLLKFSIRCKFEMHKECFKTRMVCVAFVLRMHHNLYVKIEIREELLILDVLSNILSDT